MNEQTPMPYQAMIELNNQLSTVSEWVESTLTKIEGNIPKLGAMGLLALTIAGCINNGLIIDSAVIAQEAQPTPTRTVCQMGYQNLPRVARCNPDADPEKVKEVFGGGINKGQ